MWAFWFHFHFSFTTIHWGDSSGSLGSREGGDFLQVLAECSVCNQHPKAKSHFHLPSADQPLTLHEAGTFCPPTQIGTSFCYIFSKISHNIQCTKQNAALNLLLLMSSAAISFFKLFLMSMHFTVIMNCKCFAKEKMVFQSLCLLHLLATRGLGNVTAWVKRVMLLWFCNMQ